MSAKPKQEKPDLGTETRCAEVAPATPMPAADPLPALEDACRAAAQDHERKRTERLVLEAVIAAEGDWQPVPATTKRGRGRPAKPRLNPEVDAYLGELFRRHLDVREAQDAPGWIGWFCKAMCELDGSAPFSAINARAKVIERNAGRFTMRAAGKPTRQARDLALYLLVDEAHREGFPVKWDANVTSAFERAAAKLPPTLGKWSDAQAQRAYLSTEGLFRPLDSSDAFVDATPGDPEFPRRIVTPKSG